MSRFLLLFVFIVLQLSAMGQQIQVRGTVYERTARYGLPGVSVMGSGGTGAVTDSTGHYTIRVKTTDSISFSYQGKPTMKFPVKEMPPNRIFDVGLHVDVKFLPTVEVKTNSYRVDSLAFREEYKKVFNYSTDYFTAVNGGAGINLDALLSMRKIKRMEHFRGQLEEIEREKYVDYRFNGSLVKRLTGLEPPLLDSFMVHYRPSYDMILVFRTEYDYYEYIKESAAYYQRLWRREHPFQD